MPGNNKKTDKKQYIPWLEVGAMERESISIDLLKEFHKNDKKQDLEPHSLLKNEENEEDNNSQHRDVDVENYVDELDDFGAQSGYAKDQGLGFDPLTREKETEEEIEKEKDLERDISAAREHEMRRKKDKQSQSMWKLMTQWVKNKSQDTVKQVDMIQYMLLNQARTKATHGNDVSASKQNRVSQHDKHKHDLRHQQESHLQRHHNDNGGSGGRSL